MIKRIVKVLVPLAIIAALIVGGYFYWQHERHYPSTDDAYIQAHVINIAPRINGRVDAVYVSNHQHVKKGQRLFAIDPTPFTIAVAKAQSQLDTTKEKIAAAEMAVESANAVLKQRQAELADTQLETNRTLTLMKKSFVSRSQGDLAVKNLKVAEAAVAAAKSNLKQAIQQRGEPNEHNAQLRAAQADLASAQLNLSYTRIQAPTSGYIANFTLRHGDTVSAYQEAFALIDDHTWWSEANFKETQLQRIKPGQKATITLDMYPGKKFTGHVMSISNGSGSSFSLLPAENASGNWVKVTQRFPIRILVNQKPNAQYPLRLGASNTVTVDTTTP